MSHAKEKPAICRPQTQPLNVPMIHPTVETDVKRNRKGPIIDPTSYKPALDSIRGIAVLFVILMHAEYYFFDPNLAWFSGGFLGVDIFFVLSGFLITRILLQSAEGHGRWSYGAFYFNRMLRLIPALAVLLIVYYAYSRAIGQHQLFDVDAILSIVFYYFNWFLISTLQAPEGLGHMWSLAVEEQFYLLWPLVLALLLRRVKTARITAFCLFGLIGSVMIWRAYLWQIDTNWLFLYVRTDTRIDSILTGALLAYLLSKNLLEIPHIRVLSPIAAMALLVAMFSLNRQSAFLYLGGFTLIAALASVLIYHAVQEDPQNAIFFDWAILRWLGKISYGLYLWHMPIFSLVSTNSNIEAGVLQVSMAFSILFVVTLLSWYCVEHPFLRVKARL